MPRACFRPLRMSILGWNAIRTLRYPSLKTYLAQFGQLPVDIRGSVLRRTAAIFLAACAVTAVAARESHVVEREAGRLRFNSISDKIVTAVSENMEAYEQVLRGGVSLFEAFGTVSRKQFAAYVNGLKLPTQYPGIQGVGFTAVIEKGHIPALESAVRMEGLRDFKVHPGGERELYSTILYLEPLDWRNRRALGFDMYSETVRREAMRRAWKTGRPALSGGVTLLQETSEDVQRGVLLYIPVFHEEIDTNLQSGVRRTLRGFVYSPFRMRDLLSRVLARTDSYSTNVVRVEIFDGPNPDAWALLFDSAAKSTHGVESSEEFSYIQQRSLALHGATWGIRLTSLPEFERQIASSHTLATSVIGLLLGALAAALFGIVNLGKESAHYVADQFSNEIEARKRAQQQTRVALRELAHRVKNTLTIVIAIASQTVRHSKDLSEFDGKFRARLLGLSRVHDLLTSGRSYTTHLSALAEEVLKPYQGDNDASLDLDGPSVELAPNTAIMLSMLFNELATNATKYGAWSVARGRVGLTWRIEDGVADDERSLCIVWRERDGPPVNAPNHRGFGSNVIKFSVERSLRGKAHADYAPEGVTYNITIPWHDNDAEDVTAENGGPGTPDRGTKSSFAVKFLAHLRVTEHRKKRGSPEYIAGKRRKEEIERGNFKRVHTLEPSVENLC